MKIFFKVLICFGLITATFILSDIKASTKLSEIPRVDAVYRTPYRHNRVMQNKIIGVGVAIIACAGSIIFMYKRGYKIQNQFTKNGIEANTYSWKWSKRKIYKRVKEITIALQDPHIINDKQKLRCYVTAKFYRENDGYFDKPMYYNEIKILETHIPRSYFLADVKRQDEEKDKTHSERWQLTYEGDNFYLNFISPFNTGIGE